MEKNSRLMMGDGRAVLSWIMIFALIFSMISTAFANPVQAKSARSAVVVEVTGDVTYTKSGGSRSNDVYTDLKLNQGDSISTGSSSSVVLRIVDRDDELTIGENSEVYIADLLESGNGKKSKVKSWAGSMWAKVKSLVSSDDEFEVDTPTAVMGVRGTHFLTNVDKKTGSTSMIVAAGVVSATKVNSNGDSQSPSQQQQTVTVYPAQQIHLNPNSQTDLKTKVEYVNTQQLVSEASPSILQAIIKDTPDIKKEQSEQKGKLDKMLERGQEKPDDNSILKIKSQEDLNKVKQNFDALIPNLAKQAVDSKKVDQKAINDANDKITDPNSKIDLNKVPPIDKNAGVDPEVEKLKKETSAEEAEAARKQQQEQDRMQEIQNNLANFLSRIEEERRRMEELNRQNEETEKQKAAQQYMSTLDEEAKKQFEQNQQKNAEKVNNTQAPPASGPSSSSSSANYKPAAPVLVSPTSMITTANPVSISMKSAANTVIRIFNGNVEVGNANGNGDTEVVIPLKDLAAGTYNLTAIAYSGGYASDPVALPAITVADVTLTQIGGVQNGQVTLGLSMKNFNGSKAFYAVEAHLVYDKTSFTYTGSEELTDVPGTVFDGAQTAETLRQVSGTVQNELIYAGTQFGTGANLSFDGEKTLVTIPLQVTAASSPAQVKLVYVKVVDNNGNTVFEMNTPRTLSVATK